MILEMRLKIYEVLKQLKEEIDKSIVTVEDFNIPILAIDVTDLSFCSRVYDVNITSYHLI